MTLSPTLLIWDISPLTRILQPPQPHLGVIRYREYHSHPMRNISSQARGPSLLPLLRPPLFPADAFLSPPHLKSPHRGLWLTGRCREQRRGRQQPQVHSAPHGSAPSPDCLHCNPLASLFHFLEPGQRLRSHDLFYLSNFHLLLPASSSSPKPQTSVRSAHENRRPHSL